MWTTVIMIGVFVLFFVFMSRSNKKREMETRQMLDALQIGDEVTMTSGIIGQIVSIKDETIVIETSRERTKIRFLKTAVARVDVSAIDSVSAPKSVKKAAEKARAKAELDAAKAESDAVKADEAIAEVAEQNVTDEAADAPEAAEKND